MSPVLAPALRRWVSRMLPLASDDLLRDAVYRRLWSSILISSLGGQVTLLAIPLTAAVLLHASPSQMGFLTSTELVPFVLFGLPAGVWLDRVHKLRVYLIGELLIGAAVLSVPVTWWWGTLSITWLCTVGFVIGSVYTVAGSAAQIVLTQVVPRERLIEAHAKNALANSTAEVVGPALAGAIIKVTGPPVALLADAVLLVFSAAILRGLRVQESTIRGGTRFTEAMRAGIVFIRDQPLLVAMAFGVGTWQFANQAATVVHLLFATRELGLSARSVGFCYMALGVGTISASFLGNRIARRLGSGPMMTAGFVVTGLGWLLLSVAPIGPFGVAAYATMLLCFGIGAVFIYVNFLSLRQAVTPGPMLGRMTTTMRWLTLLPSAPGALFGGWLAEHTSLRTTLAFAGTLSIAVAIASFRMRILRDTRDLPTIAS